MKLVEHQYDNADEVHFKRDSHTYNSTNLVIDEVIIESSGEENYINEDSDQENKQQ